MYEYIKGILVQKSSSFVVIDNNGIGYRIEISGMTFMSLPDLKENVKLFIYHYIREDAQRFYGFAHQDEREIFIHLIGVNKIGPKVASSVLSSISINDLVLAVSSGDSTPLKCISGIGPKTADRLIIELKGKINKSHFSQLDTDAIPGTVIPLTPTEVSSSQYKEIADALISLGYVEAQVMRAIKRVEEVVDKNAPIEEWIKKALQVM